MQKLLHDSVIAVGGNESHVKKIIELCDQLAVRGNFDSTSIMLIVIDSIESGFNSDQIQQQLKINCGCFDFLPIR